MTKLIQELLNKVTQRTFHLVCQIDPAMPSDYEKDYFRRGLADTRRYLERLDNKVDFVGKSVLDVGCGFGATCIYLAKHGASQVVGIDINERYIEFANTTLSTEYSDLADTVRFQVVTSPMQIGEQTFDIILSKDSFEHMENPGEMVRALEEHLAEDGIVVIGFGPLWKSPWGGHIDYMTKLPWAHLLFPESVIMNERKRFRPHETATRFEEVQGGLNKMTLRKFRRIMESTNLRPIYFTTNVQKRTVTKTFTILRRLPYCEEYFTFNVYSIWGRGAAPQPLP